jgi:CII-binding regulator of phage lambda lysogenization HflD
MKPPRPVRAAPGSMAGMREKHLRQMLEQLHTELQRADTIDDRSRELLRSVLGDIEDLLERKQKRGTKPESIIEQLREAVRAFETTHPTLTSAIGRVADALAGIGI